MEAILAMDTNNGISKEGIIPWKSSKDLNFFYNKTKNHVVIMGKNTYLSLPDNSRPLKNRLNIVLTTYPDLFLNDMSECDNNVIFTNNDNIHNAILKNKVSFNRFYPALSPNFKIFIIGGKQLYEKYIPLCNTVWLTRFKKCYSCDLTFDINLENEFKEVESKEDNEIKISKYIKI